MAKPEAADDRDHSVVGFHIDGLQEETVTADSITGFDIGGNFCNGKDYNRDMAIRPVAFKILQYVKCGLPAEGEVQQDKAGQMSSPDQDGEFVEIIKSAFVTGGKNDRVADLVNAEGGTEPFYLSRVVFDN